MYGHKYSDSEELRSDLITYLGEKLELVSFEILPVVEGVNNNYNTLNIVVKTVSGYIFDDKTETSKFITLIQWTGELK